VTKYALTGDFGFGDKKISLGEMVKSHYGSMSFEKWIEIKKSMALGFFLPVWHPVTQIGLNTDFGATEIDVLRSWDFVLITKGNSAVVFFILLSAFFYFRRSSSKFEHDPSSDMPFFYLLGISICSWIFLVMLFMIPPVIHHWPQAALFGLAIGGTVIVYSQSKKIFFVLVLGYTFSVWIVSPLRLALLIDPFAATYLTGAAIFGLYFNLKKEKTLA
jgi:hypothetical protein